MPVGIGLGWIAKADYNIVLGARAPKGKTKKRTPLVTQVSLQMNDGTSPEPRR